MDWYFEPLNVLGRGCQEGGGYGRATPWGGKIVGLYWSWY